MEKEDNIVPLSHKPRIGCHLALPIAREKTSQGFVLRLLFRTLGTCDRLYALSVKVGRTFSFRASVNFPWEGVINFLELHKNDSGHVHM